MRIQNARPTGSSTTSRKCEVIFDVENRRRKVTDLEHRTSAPGFWNDQNAAKAILAEVTQQKQVLVPFDQLSRLIEDVQVLLELAEVEDNPTIRTQVSEEIERDLVRAQALFEKLELQSLLSERFDFNNAFVTLHAGAGGTESCDWASMLLRLFRRYCERQEFAVEMLDLQPGDEAGVKSAQFLVTGPYAYGHLKSERGVHRLVRISPFDSNKRRHTSFASLDLVAELTEDVEVEIDEKDLRVDTFRSSGAGGQHVNKTDSAIRLTHLPTGIVVSCQAERSQHNNRAKAMRMLTSRLYELQQDQKRQEMERFYGNKGEIAWGSQIRSYVLQPYTMVKDHRTGEQTSNVQAVLDGEIEPFVQAFLKDRKKAGVASGSGGGAASDGLDLPDDL